MNTHRLGLLIGLIVILSTACATAGAASYAAGTTQYNTLMSGWEKHFRIEWTASDQSPSARTVSGYVYSQHGEYATQLRVLAQAVDSSGAVIRQRIGYIPGGVGGFGRAYFVVSNMPVADAYRVSVWDYTWFQAPKDTR